MSLPRVDSTSAFSSLLGYAASDSESDEEKQEQEETDKKPAEVQAEVEKENKMKRYATRLVSYPGDEGEEGANLDDSTEMGEDAMEVVTEEQDGEENSNSNTGVQIVNSAYLDASNNSTLGSAFAESIKNKASEEVTLPPEPTGRCSKHLQDKISRCYRKYDNMNPKIQNNKEFRNPSIYEKLISYLSIDQLGTNYPKEMYDPHVWEESSYYEALSKAQREDMARREKEKKEKTKVEFVTGVAKKLLPIDQQMKQAAGAAAAAAVSTGSGASTSTAQILGEEPERKRKSKWGMQTNPNLVQTINPIVPNRPQFTVITTTITHPVVVSTTTTTSSTAGSKTTVISSVGTLKKPKIEK